MKSRVLAVLFAAMLAAGTLAGCGSKAAENTAIKTEDTKEETANDTEENVSDTEDSEEEDASEADTTVTLEDSEEGDAEEEAGDSVFSDASEDENAIVEIDTSKELTGIHHADINIRDYGEIQVELDADTAPVTVTNFVKLVQDDFYDGLTFWRIMDGFMMQGGDPKGNGTGGSGETIKGEFSSNGVDNDISHTRGTISMARSTDPDSASSQFFIVQSDSTFLDGDYAAFGHVTEGMDIVDKICKEAKPTDDNGSIKADEQPVIESIRIID